MALLIIRELDLCFRGTTDGSATWILPCFHLKLDFTGLWSLAWFIPCCIVVAFDISTILDRMMSGELSPLRDMNDGLSGPVTIQPFQ